MRDRNAPCRFGIVLYEDVEPIDLGGTIGVISMAARVLPNIGAVTIAARPGAVRLAGGLTVLANHGFSDAPACDVLVVTGGPGWHAQVTDENMLGFLRSQPPARLASVCTGALILGAAGLLENVAATTRRHAVGQETEAPLRLLERYGAHPREVPFVANDAGPATGGGVSLAHDLTLHLIERFYGAAARRDVAKVLEYDRAYAANQAAFT